MATISLFISLLAVAISIFSLWKSELAPFSALAVAGELKLRLFPIRSGAEEWFIASFLLPLSVTNQGARPGIVKGLRLRLHFPQIPIPGNCELVPAKYEVADDRVHLIDKNRFQWVDEASNWMPFAILPKATITKNLLFETRWDDPVVQPLVECTLETADASDTWQPVATWTISLTKEVWGNLAQGGAFSFDPKEAGRALPTCVPEDLHRYTGTKEKIPKDAFAAPNSYLNFPDDGPNSGGR